MDEVKGMEFSTIAKRQLVDGAIATLSSFAEKRREMDPWEGHHITQVVAHMESDAYAHAIRHLMLFAKRPAERDSATVKIIAEQPQQHSVEELHKRLEVVKAALS